MGTNDIYMFGEYLETITEPVLNRENDFEDNFNDDIDITSNTTNEIIENVTVSQIIDEAIDIDYSDALEMVAEIIEDNQELSTEIDNDTELTVVFDNEENTIVNELINDELEELED